MAQQPIYLDYNATTPVDPLVLEAMLPYFTTHPGNAASRSHPFGWLAEEAVTTARTQLAQLLGVTPKELIFTSGATESTNLAIKGIYELYQRKGRHLITLPTEHRAVLDAHEQLVRQGAEVTYLPVDADGRVSPAELAAAIRPDTILVSIMWANNETGVVQDMAALGQVCAEKGVLLHSDATQAVGKIPADPVAAGVHLLACSAHKLYGPKGVGALYIRGRRPKVRVSAQLHGGGHEQGVRSGTLNVPGIVGFGKAAELAGQQMSAEAERLRELRDYLEQQLLQRLPAVSRNGHAEERLPHVSNLSFKYIEGEALMMTFNQQLAVSSGSACTSASLEPSHVLRAMGCSAEDAHAAIRFSLGRFTTRAEIEQVIEWVVAGVEQLRAESPLWELHQATAGRQPGQSRE
jgi:cysteine desulfurase